MQNDLLTYNLNFLGWLLTTCTNPVAASNAKLALFYDWLFYDQEKVGIMF